MPTAIQFLRSDNPQLRPNPDTLADGMPMLNTNEQEPGLFFKARDSSLIKIGPCVVGGTAPNSGAQGFEGNTKGEMWLDTSGTGRPRLRVYTGEEWTENPDVTIDQDQTITGQKTFTQAIVAEGGVTAFGQDIFSESLILSGTASSALTEVGMQDNILTTKSYVDDKTENPTLSNALIAGDYIIGFSFDGSQEVRWRVDADNTGTNNLVARDLNGNFTAGTITASLNGVASDCSREIIAGDGLTGGGVLTTNLTIGIDRVDDTLIVDDLGVRVDPNSTTIPFLEPAITVAGANYSGGSLGVGVTTPAATLDVGGFMKLANLTEDPADGEVGMIACVNNDLKFHNGTDWVTVTTS